MIIFLMLFFAFYGLAYLIRDIRIITGADARSREKYREWEKRQQEKRRIQEHEARGEIEKTNGQHINPRLYEELNKRKEEGRWHN